MYSSLWLRLRIRGLGFWRIRRFEGGGGWVGGSVGGGEGDVGGCWRMKKESKRKYEWFELWKVQRTWTGRCCVYQFWSVGSSLCIFCTVH